MAEADLVPLGDGRRVTEGLAQLADVVRPTVLEERPRRAALQTQLPLGGQQRGTQEPEILAARAQRGQVVMWPQRRAYRSSRNRPVSTWWGRSFSVADRMRTSTYTGLVDPNRVTCPSSSTRRSDAARLALELAASRPFHAAPYLAEALLRRPSSLTLRSLLTQAIAPMASLERTLLVGDASDVWNVAFSPDGKRLVTGSGGTGTVWSADGRQVAAHRRDGHWHATAFSPDGRLVAMSGIHAVDVFRADSGARVSTFDAGAPAQVAFTPDGKRIIVGGDAGDLRLYDAQTRGRAGPGPAQWRPHRRHGVQPRRHAPGGGEPRGGIHLGCGPIRAGDELRRPPRTRWWPWHMSTMAGP